MEHLEYAENLVRKAESYLSQAKGEIKEVLPSYSNIVSLCQLAIELSGKAIFKVMDLEYPREHQLLLEKNKRELMQATLELFRKEFPKYFAYKEEIPRVIFLTYFWYNFRTLANYGLGDLPPDRFFTKDEAELALKHAERCVSVAQSLLDAKRAEVRS